MPKNEVQPISQKAVIQLRPKFVAVRPVSQNEGSGRILSAREHNGKKESLFERVTSHRLLAVLPESRGDLVGARYAETAYVYRRKAGGETAELVKGSYGSSLSPEPSYSFPTKTVLEKGVRRAMKSPKDAVLDLLPRRRASRFVLVDFGKKETNPPQKVQILESTT